MPPIARSNRITLKNLPSASVKARKRLLPTQQCSHGEAGPLSELRPGTRAPLRLDGRCVGYWVCTRAGARPVVAHAASTQAARTPVTLQEARRVAREARALSEAEAAFFPKSEDE